MRVPAAVKYKRQQSATGGDFETLIWVVNTMLQVRLSFALVCLTFTGVAWAGNDCGAAKSHAGQRECLERAGATSRAALVSARAALTKRIQSWDEEPSYRRKALQHLAQSFVHLKAFRHAKCEFEAASAAGGNR